MTTASEHDHGPAGDRRMTAGARRPHRGSTGRLLVLVGVVVLLVVVLAAPLHRYLSARGAVGQEQDRQRAARVEIEQLSAQQKQWSDPAYVASQARTRLQYAMPGDTVYVVVSPATPSGSGPDRPADSSPTRLSGRTWNERMWGSLHGADSAP